MKRTRKVHAHIWSRLLQSCTTAFTAACTKFKKLLEAARYSMLKTEYVPIKLIHESDIGTR